MDVHEALSSLNSPKMLLTGTQTPSRKRAEEWHADAHLRHTSGGAAGARGVEVYLFSAYDTYLPHKPPRERCSQSKVPIVPIVGDSQGGD